MSIQNLTDKQVLNAKADPGKKVTKLSDGGGLYLLVTATGSKLWRFKYYFGGNEKLLALGVYPDVSLAQARDRHQDARKLVADGTDPNAANREARQVAELAQVNTFAAVAAEFLEHKNMSGKTLVKARGQLRDFLNPAFGNKPLTQIEAPAVLMALRAIEAKGLIQTAHKTKQLCARIFAYGLGIGKCSRNPVTDLGKDALKPQVTKHFAAITDPAKVGELLRAIADTCFCVRVNFAAVAGLRLILPPTCGAYPPTA
jgi:hypothetical protein